MDGGDLLVLAIGFVVGYYVSCHYLKTGRAA